MIWAVCFLTFLIGIGFGVWFSVELYEDKVNTLSDRVNHTQVILREFGFRLNDLNKDT
jgi:hypothetical protein